MMMVACAVAARRMSRSVIPNMAGRKLRAVVMGGSVSAVFCVVFPGSPHKQNMGTHGVYRCWFFGVLQEINLLYFCQSNVARVWRKGVKTCPLYLAVWLLKALYQYEVSGDLRNNPCEERCR